jgi:signal transduction histidine kinase/DNA-binding response OmpR family regulator
MSEVHDAAILIVDDEQANLDLLLSCLGDEGYARLVATRDPREVLRLCDVQRPDLILLDLHMPLMDGFAVLKQLRGHLPEDEYLPILVLTADVTDAAKQRALSGGATDFLTKPLDITEVILRIGNLLETRKLHQHQRAARERAEEVSRRATFLADASQVLASSFDYTTTLSVLCRAVVPRIADYCVVDVLDPEGGISRVGLAHVDPDKEEILRELSYLEPNDDFARHPVLAALKEGQRTLVRHVLPGMLDVVTRDENNRRNLERLGPQSLIVTPLLASGRIHGALVLVQSESGRSFEPDDLELACELARRAGMTIENARLFNQAQQATRARDELLAVVAHDLRNPLSTVTMGSTMLFESATTDAQRKHSQMVARAAERMRRLIDDLLESTRIDTGKLHIELRSERIDPFVREAVTMLKPLADARHIKLFADPCDGLPRVMMDASRVMQVLSNLVGNALKFTPEGGQVRIRCETVEEGVRFAVSDTGPGIPADQIPYIFGRFWQARDGDTRGVGLGLSIVRGIVDNHKGRVWVESTVGQGATFFFTLPFAEPTEAIPPSQAMVAEPQDAIAPMN